MRKLTLSTTTTTTTTTPTRQTLLLSQGYGDALLTVFSSFTPFVSPQPPAPLHPSIYGDGDGDGCVNIDTGFLKTASKQFNINSPSIVGNAYIQASQQMTTRSNDDGDILRHKTDGAAAAAAVCPKARINSNNRVDEQQCKVQNEETKKRSKWND
jgi:hypothetical protein